MKRIRNDCRIPAGKVHFKAHFFPGCFESMRDLHNRYTGMSEQLMKGLFGLDFNCFLKYKRKKIIQTLIIPLYFKHISRHLKVFLSKFKDKSVR